MDARRHMAGIFWLGIKIFMLSGRKANETELEYVEQVSESVVCAQYSLDLCLSYKQSFFGTADI